MEASNHFAGLPIQGLKGIITMKKLRIAAILLIASTLLLKFSSMIRDLVISGYYGDSYMADAYFAAMTIPNALILFMLTGMKDAFLPSYYKYDRLGKGYSHLTNVVKGTFFIGLVVSIIGVVISPGLVRVLYPEFGRYEEGWQIAGWTAAIYFLSIAFVGINAVYEGYFDSQKKFSFSTFSQTVVVLTTVAFAIGFQQQLGIYSVPLGYLVGTLLSLLIKVLYLKPGRLLDWKQRADWLEIKSFYIVFLPVGITIAVGQINLTVNMLFAAGMQEGVVSNLNYAFRLVSIPQAIFGVTIATMIFPFLAKAKAENDSLLFKQGIERGLTYMFLFLAPTVTGMVILIEPIVSLVYERGAFNSIAAAHTSEYAVLYMGSVFFYSIQAVIAKGFYVLEKGHLIMRIGLISIVINVISNYLLSKWFGPPGLALSASIVGLLYSAMTFITLYKISGGFKISTIRKEFLKITIAAAVMVMVLTLLENLLPSSDWTNLKILIVKVPVGGIVFISGLLLLKSRTFRLLLKRENLDSQ